MPRERVDDLSAIEQAALAAALRLHPNGYGVSIRDEILARTGRDVSFGTIYATTERLTDRGFLESRRGEATAERGGRAKLYFTITGEGQRALHRSRVAADAMFDGLDTAGVPA